MVWWPPFKSYSFQDVYYLSWFGLQSFAASVIHVNYFKDFLPQFLYYTSHVRLHVEAILHSDPFRLTLATSLILLSRRCHSEYTEALLHVELWLTPPITNEWLIKRDYYQMRYLICCFNTYVFPSRPNRWFLATSKQRLLLLFSYPSSLIFDVKLCYVTILIVTNVCMKISIIIHRKHFAACLCYTSMIRYSARAVCWWY